MLWKPIVYGTVKRTTEDNTLMQIYDLENNVLLDQSNDQGIFRALYKQFYISAFNISLGCSKDSKSKFSFFYSSNICIFQNFLSIQIIHLFNSQLVWIHSISIQ